jgi:hypothetical protein
MIKEAITRFSLVVIDKLDAEEFSEWIETTDIEKDVQERFVLCSRLVRQRNKKDVYEMLKLFLDNFETGLRE